MLARQLCVFDDKTDSKSKPVKKLIVWLCYLVLFVKTSICDALSSHNLFNDISEYVKELDLIREQLKLLSSTKCYCW